MEGTRVLKGPNAHRRQLLVRPKENKNDMRKGKKRDKRSVVGQTKKNVGRLP